MTNVLIVEARYYTRIADMQLEGAKKALEKAGAQYDVVTVPGALEIPLAILFAAKAAEGAGKGYDGYVALGCIMRGETYHFEIVSNESARGLTNLGLQHGLCIGNGILTVENEEQALVRAAPTDGEDSDKGGGAARACLALIEIRNKFGAHR